MNTGELVSVVEPWLWACLLLAAPGSWTGDALCLVMLRSIVNGAHHCRTVGARAPGKHLSIWGNNCVFHWTHDGGIGL